MQDTAPPRTAAPALEVAGDLVTLIRSEAERLADVAILRFLGDRDGEETCITYAELDLRARAIASRLQARPSAGARALVLHPPGIDYIAALIGCLYAGVIAVPAYPPRMNRSIERLRDIVVDAQAQFALTTSGALARLTQQQDHPVELMGLEWVATDQCSLDGAAQWSLPRSQPDDVVLLQYTSGSTSAPKGVVLTHEHFLNNLRALVRLRDPRGGDHIVSWLPPYHDMGLVTATLTPLATGITATLMAPTAFLQRPSRWLQAISRYRGTISGGPNFAYELCCRRVSDRQREELDLSCWRLAFSGAERVRASTLRRFGAMFASSGFRSRAFTASYGLAEATLGVCATPVESEPCVASLAEDALAQGRAIDAAPGARAREIVSCGVPFDGIRVLVVDPNGRQRMSDGSIGEIWVDSPATARGYWRKPEIDADVFRARLAPTSDASSPSATDPLLDDGMFLRTGDLGFLKEGELFVTGRIKELIILRGANHYPEDIEAALDGAHERLRAGCAAAFGVDVGEERLVIVQEVESVRDLDPTAIIESIRGAVAEQLQLEVFDVVLIEPGSIPKTSSGKLQRGQCRKAYLDGSLSVLARRRPTDGPEQSSVDVERVGAVMAAVLGVDRMAPEEDFFWLGGHSLLATQLVSRVRETFAADVSLRDVFDSPTPAALARRIAKAQPLVAQGPIARVDRSGPLPLSFSQERMWLLQQLDPRGTAYNVAGAAVIDGPLDAPALHTALHAVIQRHEVLRSNYRTEQGRVVLTIAAGAQLPLEVIDLRGELAPLEAAQSRASDFAGRPFDVAVDLLVRAVLFRTGADQHVLCVCLHHLVTDGWSMGIFVGDMLKIYTSISSGQPAELAEPRLSYVDYAHWQRSYLTDARLAGQLAHWTGVLAGAEPVDLPTDRPRSARRSSAGAVEPLALSAELLAALRAFAVAEGCTLFMVMLAAFEALLARYTNRSDLVVGVPVANRNWMASEELMGTLVNTLAVRVRFDPEASFRELLKTVRAAALDAYSHQDLPFERLVSALPLERHAGESPLVRVMFDFQNAPMPGGTAGKLVMRPLVVSRRAAQFDLSLLIRDSELGQIASVEYSSELFERQTILRLLEHYSSLLEVIALRPEVAVSRLPLMSAAEQAVLVELGARSAPPPLADRELPPGFTQQVSRARDAVAVIDADGQLTYGDLATRVSRLTRRLIAAGGGPGQRVAVCLERSSDLVVALLAALKSGTAYVPLDPRHPPDRVAGILADADVRVVMTASHSRNELRVPAGASVVFVDAPGAQADPKSDAESVLSALEDGADMPPIAADAAAYLIYTSGSTGKPKGVEVSRGALANFLRSMQHTPGATAADRLLSVTTVAFDIAGLELLLPLSVGACVHVASSEVVADGRQLLGLMRAFGPTIMQATPATWRMLLDVGWSGDPRLKILCGGEALPRGLAGKLLERCGSLWNMYGPTETTVWSTVHRVGRGESITVPIGKPIDATRLYVLDGHGQLVPHGVRGELYIGGHGVANGYFRRPELTRERFVPDPFTSEPGARMYRTGDAARWRTDGVLEYMGRLDHQIKLRGFRIEPAEIEVAVKTHARVRDALVVARDAGPGDTRLVAYCVIAPHGVDESTLAAELFEICSRKLPAYMIPAAFVALTDFPHTPNGKIDRAALPAPHWGRGADAEHIAPRDEVESTLQELWQEALGTSRVGVRDSFFALGGHSLLATRLFASMERAFGVRLPLALLFERPTIEFIAEHIRTERVQRSAAMPSDHGAAVMVAPPASPVSAARFVHLVPIRSEGSHPRLFCVHGAGGQVLNFWALSRHMGPHQPFYALQAAGVDGVRSPHSHIEDMATAYLAELREVQPHGPYHLAGYCGGGWVAYEMATRLRSMGEEVALLALLDAYGPHRSWAHPRLGGWLQGAASGGAGYLLRKAHGWIDRNLDAGRQAARIAMCRVTGDPVPYELRDGWLTRAFLHAAAGYRPRVFDGRVTLLLAKDVTPPPDAIASEYGWQGLAPAGLHVLSVPGTHHTLTDHPNVIALAETLTRCIRLAADLGRFA